MTAKPKGRPIWVVIVEYNMPRGNSLPIFRISHKIASWTDPDSVADTFDEVSDNMSIDPGVIKQVMYFERSISIEEIEVEDKV